MHISPIRPIWNSRFTVLVKPNSSRMKPSTRSIQGYNSWRGRVASQTMTKKSRPKSSKRVLLANFPVVPYNTLNGRSRISWAQAEPWNWPTNTPQTSSSRSKRCRWTVCTQNSKSWTLHMARVLSWTNKSFGVSIQSWGLVIYREISLLLMFEELLKKDNTLIYSTRFGTFCNEIVTQGTGLTRPTATSRFFCN